MNNTITNNKNNYNKLFNNFLLVLFVRKYL